MPQLLGAAASVASSARSARASVATAASTVKSSATDKKDKFKDSIETWVKVRVAAKVANAVDLLPGVVKDSLEDPDMPRCASRGKDRMIDGIWPDLRQEIMYAVAEGLDTKKKKDEQEAAQEGGGSDCFRAFLRYHLFPFDKSIWGKLKDPGWVLFRSLSLVPWAGMTPFVFTFLFLIIDHSDEFQLLFFILQFKGTQFLSAGIARTVVGFFQYFSCATIPATRSDHLCDKTGPGLSENIYVLAGGWVLQVILIWMAFFMLPRAKAKGRRDLNNQEIERLASTAASAMSDNGGYVKYLMLYDLACFALCIGAVTYVLCTRPSTVPGERDAWVSRQAFFACQVIYGYLSIPFFFLTLPGIQAVLTHTVPTGYDRQGRCKRLKKAKPPPAETPTVDEEVEADEDDPPEKKSASLVSMEEVAELRERLKNIVLNGASGRESPRGTESAEAIAEAAAEDRA